MKDAAAILGAFAALVSALAWPIAFLIIFYLFRHPFREVLQKLPLVIDRMQKVKIGILEAELDKTARSVGVEAGSGQISAEVVRSAAVIKIEAKALDLQALRDQLQRLCTEYDITRQVMSSGSVRTRTMDQTVSKMRALSSGFINKRV